MESFGFDNKDVKSTSFDKFKGEKGRTYTVSFAHDDPNKFFVGGKQHYSNRLQKGWACLSTATSQEVCCTHDYDGNEAKWRIGCILVVYRVDDGVVKGIDKVLPWTFSAKQFELLKKIYKEFGHVDLTLTCTNGEYQNFDVLPKKNCAWMGNDKLKEYVLANSKKMYERLPKMISTKMSEAEIRENLGLGGGSASDSASGLDLSNIAGSLDG